MSWKLCCILSVEPDSLHVLSHLTHAPSPVHLRPQTREQYSELRDEFYAGLEDRRYLALAEARTKAPRIDWSDPANAPVKPAVLGSKLYADYSIEEVLPYIDWNPFFQARGRRWNSKVACMLFQCVSFMRRRGVREPCFGCPCTSTCYSKLRWPPASAMHASCTHCLRPIFWHAVWRG